MKDLSWFVSICSANGLKLTNEQTSSFDNYLRLLLSWNSKVNLISRKDEDNFYSHHALNSISFLFIRKLKPDAKILDLGTGGGLPGIPLKILHPHLNLAMLDSIAKKTAVLSDIVDRMQLNNVSVMTGRAEELAKLHEFHGKFDYVVSRAAGKLDEVTKWSRGFLERFELPPQDFTRVAAGGSSIGAHMIPVGSLVALKGGAIDPELKIARNLKFVESIEVEDIIFSGMDEIDNKEKKLVMVKYRPIAAEKEH